MTSLKMEAKTPTKTKIETKIEIFESLYEWYLDSESIECFMISVFRDTNFNYDKLKNISGLIILNMEKCKFFDCLLSCWEDVIGTDELLIFSDKNNVPIEKFTIIEAKKIIVDVKIYSIIDDIKIKLDILYARYDALADKIKTIALVIDDTKQ